MTRSDQLKFCKICLNRTFSTKEGIICKLTNSKANFINTCSEYDKDIKTVNSLEHKSNFKNRIQPDYMFGLDYIGIKDGITAGSIVIVVALIWISVGLFVNQLIYFKPLILLLIGIIAVVISATKPIQKKEKKVTLKRMTPIKFNLVYVNLFNYFNFNT